MATTFTTTHSVTTKIDSNMIVDSTDTHVAYLRYDEDSENADPLDLDGNLGIMAAYHTRYNLGHSKASEVEQLKAWLDDAGQYDYYEDGEGEYPFYDLPDDKDCTEPIGSKVERFCKKVFGSTVVLPLYLMDHSGISMSVGAFGCPWDSGQVGWIFDTEQTRKDCGLEGLAPEKVSETLTEQVKEYDLYIRGEIYGIVVAKHEDGEINEEVESCWGFVGHEYAEEAAKGQLDWHTKQASLGETSA